MNAIGWFLKSIQRGILDIFNSFFDIQNKHVLSLMCKKCGRSYNTFNEANICSDWDNILGVERHFWKRK